MSAGAKHSKVEATKRGSRYLRGTLADDLAAEASHLSEENVQLLKFHGAYQQVDRDTATALKQRGLAKEVRFMVRLKIPAGRLTADQYLALDALADRYGDGTLRITTRQDIQFHGVLKSGLKKAIAAVNRAAVTTLGACGDVVRNVTTTAAPIRDPIHARLEADALALTRALLPKTRAYAEIWLDGERVRDVYAEEEPLYGETYLPRKFKIGLATPSDNSIDVFSHDLGIVALFAGERLEGYNFALGGGLGMTHNKVATYPRLATPIAFVEPDDLVAATRAVVALARDCGDRGDRKHARLKYLVEERGAAWIKARLEGYFGAPLAPPRPMPPFRIPDHLGWHPQGDGKWYLGLPVPSGRLADRGGERLRSGLRRVVEDLGLDPILTPGQDIILKNVAVDARQAVERELRRHGVRLAEDLSPVRRFAMACPALPTCGLALTEAERVQPSLLVEIEDLLRRYGLAEERLSLRTTGCPNGCARPFLGDIGLVGRQPGHYALYVGGDFEGTRLNVRLLDRVALSEVAVVLEPLFAHYADCRLSGEGFGDFCYRVGPAVLLERIARARAPVRRAG